MNFFKTFFKQLRNALNFKLLYSVRSANKTHSSIFTSFQQADVIVWALVSEFHLYVSCSFFFFYVPGTSASFLFHCLKWL